MRKYLIGCLVIMLICGLVSVVMNWDVIYKEYFQTTSSKPEAGFKMPSIGRQIVTYDEYKRIQNGMSYREVVAIIGAEGEEISRNRMDGIPGIMESVETVMYQWVNNNGSNMNAMFQNDKLIQKAQFGLE